MEVVQNIYNNPEFEPRINDFEDDYHLEETESSFNEDLLTKVKKIRRRYNDWFAYSEACRIYDMYFNMVVDKYGGKQKFEIALLLNKVTDYIPNYPELRKTKKNKFHRKTKAVKETIYESNFYGKSEDDGPYIEIENAKGDLEFPKEKHIGEAKTFANEFEYDVGINNIIAEKINDEFDMLSNWYMNHYNKINSMKASPKKKHKLMNKLNRKRLLLSVPYKGLNDTLNAEEKRKRDKAFGRTKSTVMVQSKGRLVSLDDVEDEKTLLRLKEIGLNLRSISKGQTKLIRLKKDKKKKKKKNSKKISRLEDRFLNRLDTNDGYSNFDEFESDMLNLTGSRRWD